MVRKNLNGFTNSYADVIKLNQSDPKTFILEGIFCYSFHLNYVNVSALEKQMQEKSCQIVCPVMKINNKKHVIMKKN